MNSITFIDTEIDPISKKIVDIGAIKDDGNLFHSSSVKDFTIFLSGTEFVCGHNIFNHDLKYIWKSLDDAKVNPLNVIDTLLLSPLLFPMRRYHSLLKDDKLQNEDINNPLNDSIKAKDLLFDEIGAFQQTDETLKKILYLLLKDTKEFQSFFKYISYKIHDTNLEAVISEKFYSEICGEADLVKLISRNPIELAYCLVLINCKNRYSITPPWVLKNYPDIESVMSELRNRPCLTGCIYCNRALNIYQGLKTFFGFDTFRKYAGEHLQEKAVQAAVDNKSLLAVFPTGGGKSITFQIPALMSGEATKGLTVIISPLQSLMKDQVDNLEKIGITDAVTINGLLDPIERGKSFERIEDGSASLLYISPESLRSKTIERLLLGRKIVRFVVDEAHCFSSWGQDFRVDYLYIGDFIKQLQHKKNLSEAIPVSCFTATAKKKVIEDICAYFKEKLSLNLEIFNSSATRTNLRYKVFEKGNDEEKYNSARDLIEEKNCPTIIYVSRTKKARLIAERLIKDGFNATSYHGKMDVKEKSANQDAFIKGEVQIMVATSAFGMGVDKKDIGLVIHYEISDSLENYIQEAGRAGRDENITADCFVLFNEEDLSRHFILLNQTKLSIKEIQQVWKAIKDLTRFRLSVSNSALEIARKAGWDDNVSEIETRVITAIAALEDAGYLKRGQNMPRVFANSILSKNAQEAIEKINRSNRFDANQKESGIRIIKKLLSSKSRQQNNDDPAESRIDYISDHLGIVKEEVIHIVNLLREEKILADAKDLTAFIKKGENINRSLKIAEIYFQIEIFLLSVFEEVEKIFHIKQLNEDAEEKGCKDVTPNKLKTIINFWAIKSWIKRQNAKHSKNNVAIVCIQSKESLQEKLQKRHELARFIIGLMYEKSNLNNVDVEQEKEEVLIEFSVHELKEEFEKTPTLFKTSISIEDIEDALFYLSRIEAIKIEGGFLVVYNRLTIDRIEQDNKRRYRNEDYQKLNQFYENRIQQIHIVGEYAHKMIGDYRGALQFVDDYFRLNYNSFLNKHFKGSRQNDIKRNITPAKFRQLFGALSPTQLEIIKDNETKHIVVLAGPGSGKTRVLVHKLASLLLMEDVKHEQLLMVTFSRAAATEFKKRLISLIGNAAHYIDIKTFHSYCFDLLGKVGNLEKSDTILKTTIERIKAGEVEANRITKTVLVVDEAQDINADEFALIGALMEQNEEMRVIAVGDDDQNIYEFRGASSKYLQKFMEVQDVTKHELIHNYRSKNNLVQFSNEFLKKINHRLKETTISANQSDNGEIKLVHYKNGNLVNPLIQDVLSTELVGTTCVLTKTNDEALQITGLLLKSGLHAKLIQSNEGFPLQNVLEIHFLLDKIEVDNDVKIITEEVWAYAKSEIRKRFQLSRQFEICNNLIKQFEQSNPKKKYKSDLEIFIRESKLEDFYNENGETIFVSTIHKAKGKEFDNVFIMLEDFNPSTDEAKRQLYVAMTRAKRNMNIHLNGDYLDSIAIDNLQKREDDGIYSPPNEIVLQLYLKDLWLDYFILKQQNISALISGDTLIVNSDGCETILGRSVLKFSKRFLGVIETQKQKGFHLKKALVNFIIYWKKENTEEEIKVILPELYFEKSITSK
ncbi:RecQ family ATP-dependent DNA helicase [Ferruginibacter sp. HRS2-29]|uniref:RecQ family ATP-dependent DNA helicase n=1 Tax=Ferruginibacter sp. HRS2-29 TaxID=2487334 RepID=UPI0020CF35DA|nr:RecQ family ATP-dependent DNA helicase [Ferruginibacter sp. HRS2-29]MCP9751308.1 RecQ family ATP-dependent DNA helicase [Ferruginibacter sp. HRS2-29]